MSEQAKKYILLAIIVITFIATFFLEPIPQNQLYHKFADFRKFMGVKNTWDVLSNIPFIFTGALGLLYMKKYPVKVAKTSWLVFFIGVILVAPGSAYYHDTPNNQTLVWDRLPMTIGFMGLFTALISTYISEKIEKIMLPVSLLFGFASVIYWAKFDDLRFYFWVQFIPLACIPIVISMFKSIEIKKMYLFLGLFFYIVAKVVEHKDVQIYMATGGTVSGHTLKHLLAAVGPWAIAYMFKVRHLERVSS